MEHSDAQQPRLTRRFGLLPATALNMTNMIGVGPFITIPLLMSAMGGPQALVGWIIALIIVICDGMVWSELGAAMPGSGGSFHYLREAFGAQRFGRALAFLFVWQFVLSGPLEIASGYIGFAQYAGYIWQGMTRPEVIGLIIVVGTINIALLYRRIQSIARITVSLWIGTLITVLAVIIPGAIHFNPQRAFDFPAGAFNFSLGFFLGLGAATRIGIYDYLGYYDVCYIGDEVRDPGRVIPRSILISTAAVAVIYIGINLSIIGVVPWREFVPASEHAASSFIVSIFMQQLYGKTVATVFTLLVLWTAFGSVFALLLGYSRIPFAAAESGYFFRVFGKLHPTKGFPYVSLLVLGAISIIAGFFSLGTVIDALIVTRILVQFIGQVFGVMALRRTAPDMPRPYRMWLYPLPALLALFGWIFVFATTQPRVILFGLAVLGLGVGVFLLWSRRTQQWPFAPVALGLLLLLSTAAHAQQRDTLATGWRLQSSKQAGRDGARISSSTYTPKAWYRASVPSTVVGALVENGTYKDPLFGMNLRDLPGMSYKIGRIFVHLDMDPQSPFAVPWWYRKTFVLPARLTGKHVALHFDGINYRANIWLNGRRIADSSQVAGTYRRYEFDVSDVVKRKGTNVLAVEVFAPVPADLQTAWVDWNPSPPDKNMGIWQDVYLSASGDVTVRDAQVVSIVDTATLKHADLNVFATLRNHSAQPVTGTLRGKIGDIVFSRPVTLAARESALVQFTADSFPQLRVANPELWWPVELGKPKLHTLDVSFVTHNTTTDRQKVRFGIRQMTSEMTPNDALLFRVNGKRILLRGGGWTNDIFFRPQPTRQLAQMRYTLDMHLNTLRLEGNYENDRFFQNADSMGILIMTGWVCCSAWEEWKKWGPEQYAVAGASARDQMRRLRNHASVVMWLNGSDNPPPADVEQMYLDIEKQERWPNPTVSSASAKPAKLSGKSGVKMTGPYDWVPPAYWLQDTTHGGAWGYNTETSMGAAVPPLESMKRMIPARDLWPLDSVWAFHGAGGQFNQASRFNLAMDARYGPSTSALDYTTKAQLMTYEGERAMFEAYRRNKYRTTGIIQWMLNNAWPSIFWHLFDWYLLPAGGYFGAKKANEPVHVLYSYDDNSVAVISALREPLHDVRLRARVLNLDGSEQLARDTVIEVPADSSIRFPDMLNRLQLPALSPTYFVDLRLSDSQGVALSRNLYWLSTRPDLLNVDSTTWYVTPVKQYADYTALSHMAPARVTRTAQFSPTGATVTLTNSGKTIAFFLRLQVKAGAHGDEVVPVEWSDNYVTLLPGETRKLTARYRSRDLHGARPVLAVSGWNVH